MKKDSTNDILLADAVLRLQAMQNILVSRGLFTNEEFKAEIKKVSHNLLKAILEKAKVGGDLDKLIDDLDTASSNIISEN